jgi:hypothetical protein
MAPIRYGRRSETRGDTYTMVFSRGCDAGQAMVIPCTHTASSADDLISEAEHLWAAEQNSVLSRTISAGWGCVTLLCNPEREVPQAFLTEWANHVRPVRNIVQLPGEGRLVSDDGLLQIEWPRCTANGAAVALDFLAGHSDSSYAHGLPVGLSHG